MFFVILHGLRSAGARDVCFLVPEMKFADYARCIFGEFLQNVSNPCCQLADLECAAISDWRTCVGTLWDRCFAYRARLHARGRHVRSVVGRPARVGSARVDCS